MLWPSKVGTTNVAYFERSEFVKVKVESNKSIATLKDPKPIKTVEMDRCSTEIVHLYQTPIISIS